MTSLSFYLVIWTLQIMGIYFFHRSVRIWRSRATAQSMEIFECHELLVQSRDMLRDCEGFDGKFMATKINDHLHECWQRRCMTEHEFRELANSRRQQVHEK